MPAVDCTISFDSRTNSYYAGQTVYGTVDIQVNKVTPVKRLVLHIEGVAKCTWHKNRERGQDYVNNELLLFLNVHLLSKPIDLSCGRHKYKFDFLLPSMVPSSQTKERLARISYKISYKAKVIFVRPWKFDLTFDKEFFVVSGLDLSLNQNLTVPYSAGHAEMTVKLDRTGWVAGEEIAFNITLKNPNDDRIQSISSALYKNVSITFEAELCCCCCCEVTQSEAVEISENTIICSPGKSSYDNRLTIPLTCKTPSTVDNNMRIIKISYRLEVQIKKKSSPISVLNIPIKIALTPIAQNSIPTSPSNLILPNPTSPPNLIISSLLF